MSRSKLIVCGFGFDLCKVKLWRKRESKGIEREDLPCPVLSLACASYRCLSSLLFCICEKCVYVSVCVCSA